MMVPWPTTIILDPRQKRNICKFDQIVTDLMVQLILSRGPDHIKYEGMTYFKLVINKYPKQKSSEDTYRKYSKYYDRTFTQSRHGRWRCMLISSHICYTLPYQFYNPTITSIIFNFYEDIKTP